MQRTLDRARARGVLMAVATLLALDSVPVGAQAPPPWVRTLSAWSALGIRASIREERYRVEGRTASEAARRLMHDGPEVLGGRAHGLTTYRMSPQWRLLRQEDRCVARGVLIDVEIEVILPQWSGARSASEADWSTWRDFIDGLEQHEWAHRDATVEAVRGLLIHLRTVSAPTCPKLVRRVQGLIRAVE
jgi:predicted secreted Zn-dependent protease